MIDFRRAILAQPENLEAGRRAVEQALPEVDLRPLRTGAVVVAAIGASHHAAIPFVQALRNAGRRATLLSADELCGPRAAALGDAFVLVSQSGRSTETLAALRALAGAPTVAVSAQPDSPIAAEAGGWLPLGPATDTPVATLSYTATLQTLGMLADAILREAPGPGWEQLPEQASAVLDDATDGDVAERLAAELAAVTVVDAVGGGPGQATAGETALLVREGLRLPATGMSTREYLHGPMESVGPGLGAIVFGGTREAQLAADLRSFGARVALIGERGPVVAGTGSIALPAVAELASPILQILPVQLITERIARLRDLPIGELRRSQADTKVGTP